VPQTDGSVQMFAAPAMCTDPVECSGR
jgi:hypothetical protein